MKPSLQNTGFHTAGNTTH